MINFSEDFLKDIKKLSKKYQNIKKDIQFLVTELEINPNLGISIGNNLYKIRVANSSIPTGKSGGFRVITFIIEDNNITLLTIYSKTQKENLSDEELKIILEKINK